MRRLLLALLLASAPGAVRAQVPLSSLSAAGTPASTDTLPVCQTAAGCGAGQSLVTAPESYIGAAAVSGSQGNPQYNSGSGFGADPTIFDVRAFGAKGDGSTDDTAAIQAAINAATGLGVCGTVLFPPGQYLLHTATSGHLLTLTGSNIDGCTLIGQGGLSMHDGNRGVSLISNVASVDLLYVNSTGGLTHNGPRIANINFIESDGTATDKLLHYNNVNRWHDENDTFHLGAYGVYAEGASDCSDSVDTRNSYVNNSVGYRINGCAGQNVVSLSYFLQVTAGQVGIVTAGAPVGMQIIGNRFDGANVLAPAIETDGEAHISHNTFEGGPYPFIMGCADVATSSASSLLWNSGSAFEACATGSGIGRGVLIDDNIMNQWSGTPITLTCNTTSGSNQITGCTTSPATAGVTEGMVVTGSGIPAAAYPTLTRAAMHQAKFGPWVTSAPTSTSFFMSENATANNTGISISLCQSPYALQFQVASDATDFQPNVSMNNYTNGTCGWLGNDGN